MREIQTGGVIRRDNGYGRVITAMRETSRDDSWRTLFDISVEYVLVLWKR